MRQAPVPMTGTGLAPPQRTALAGGRQRIGRILAARLCCFTREPNRPNSTSQAHTDINVSPSCHVGLSSRAPTPLRYMRRLRIDGLNATQHTTSRQTAPTQQLNLYSNVGNSRRGATWERPGRKRQTRYQWETRAFGQSVVVMPTRSTGFR